MNAELIMMLAIAITQALVVGLLVVPAIEQQVDAAPAQGPLGTKKECRDTVLQSGVSNQNASSTCRSFDYTK